MDLPTRLRAHAQNEEMVDGGDTRAGRLLNEAAAEIQRLRGGQGVVAAETHRAAVARLEAEVERLKRELDVSGYVERTDALRSRVEALEGALGGTMEIIAAYEERESAAGRTDFTPTYGEMMDEARAAIAPTDKGEACPACGRPWDMRRFNACECGAVIQQPDKGEE